MQHQTRQSGVPCASRAHPKPLQQLQSTCQLHTASQGIYLFAGDLDRMHTQTYNCTHTICATTWGWAHKSDRPKLECKGYMEVKHVQYRIDKPKRLLHQPISLCLRFENCTYFLGNARITGKAHKFGAVKAIKRISVSTNPRAQICATNDGPG